jgi:CYTH domain-containing protein
MDIDPKAARALGFPYPDYTVVERERRWLCRRVPQEQVVRSERITDLYVSGSQLRLREARRLDGTAAMLRLTRKADVDARTRLVTSIYLPEHEFALLAASLPGNRLNKLRHRLESPAGLLLSVDEFLEGLRGLILLEVDFETAAAMGDFVPPDFAAREVTDDPRYGGGQLAAHGLPRDFSGE